jgi:hypothetical protein
MSTYKRPILLNILRDLYPGIQSNCGTTYASIIFATPQTLVPEQTIIDLYPSYVQKYNMNILRGERQSRLVPTDYCGLADYPFPDADIKQAWFNYRQELRTITDRYPNPEVDEDDNLIGIVWPVPPSSPTVTRTLA